MCRSISGCYHWNSGSPSFRGTDRNSSSTPPSSDTNPESSLSNGTSTDGIYWRVLPRPFSPRYGDGTFR